MSLFGRWTTFAFIQNIYGNVPLRNASEFINQSIKVVRLGYNQLFNRDCLNLDFIHKSIRCRARVDTTFGSKIVRASSQTSIKARTQDNKQRITQARRRLNTSEMFAC